MRDKHRPRRQGALSTAHFRSRIDSLTPSLCLPVFLHSALHWAVDRAHYSLVEALLTELGAAVNACDVDGATSLHYAALCEHAPLVSLLLVHGADPTIADDGGDTAADAIRSMKDATPVMIAILDKCKSKSD